MSKRLYTKISQAFWCKPDGTFQRAEIPNMKIWKDGPDNVYWFDKLFEGGIFLPKKVEGKQRALTILLTGPPGTGKSTLALELAYRWADTFTLQKGSNPNQLQKTEQRYTTLYITSESNKEWIMQKAKSLGWKNVDGIFDAVATGNKSSQSLVKIWETTDLQNFLQDQNDLPRDKAAILRGLIPIFAPPGLKKVDQVGIALKKRWDEELLKRNLKVNRPKVLFIDSLNTVEASKRPEVFKRFMYLVDSGPDIIVTVFETVSPGEGSSFWDYTSDIVIRLDSQNVSGYLIRTIEIVKARYQSHVWGKHQLKIYGPIERKNSSAQNEVGSHPYRKQGGIFIFPSMHYYLSVYKHLKPDASQDRFETPVKGLDSILQDGFPRGRCTGFIGMRGGHKSHLGYMCVLSRITRTRPGKDERALIVSLRDDENMARDTLKKILSQETDFQGNLNVLEAEDKIEILYFPPGYVTPEEVFHRVFMSVQRLKSHPGGPQVTVLFNSLDQLSSRFPLCAREQMFIPGLIATLTAENVTSFFIAVKEPGQPPEQYGLLSMADALISFTREKFRKSDYLGHIKNHEEFSVDKTTLQHADDNLPETQQIVTMRIIRFAGGQAAGAGGLLELVHSDTVKAEVYKNRLRIVDNNVQSGLVFVPFSPSHKEG